MIQLFSTAPINYGDQIDILLIEFQPKFQFSNHQNRSGIVLEPKGIFL